MPEILIQSKITTPQLHEKIVHRERLTSLLNENKNKNLIIICAPAGFGKTTLVLDYLSSQKGKHAWFSIPQKGIEDASSFFEYIIGAVQNLNNEFGSGTLEVMKQFTQNPKMSMELVYGCTASFVNEFQKCFSDDIVLIIEDLHYIDSEKAQKWLAEFFEELLNNIPSNLHLILSTRVIPEMYLTQLKARRNVLMINENDLTFNEEETAALLDEVYKYKYEDTDLKLLDENVKGWITGLHLLLQAYGEDFARVKYKGELDKEIIFDFFAHEIFDNLSPELQEFMMVTSLMESFDEELANAVLGIENSRQLTEELIHRNLFIHQVHSLESERESKKISYTYHALFRDFLNRKLQRSKLTQEIKTLMENIGNGYLNSGNEIDAVNYFLEGENFDKAVPLVVKNSLKLIDNGKYDVITNWYKLIPDNISHANADLMYFRGYLYCYINADLAQSLLFIKKAEEKYKQCNDEDGLVKCCIIRSWISLLTGKVEDVRNEIEKLLDSRLKPKNTINICCQLSRVYCRLTEYKRAIEVLEKALNICDTYNIEKLSTYNSFGSVYLEMGDYEKAKFYFEKSPSPTINANYSMIISAYTSMGKYSDSIKYFNNALKILNNSFSRYRYVQMLNQQALLLKAIGDFEESIKMLENIYPLAKNYNIASQLCYITANLFDNYFYLGDQNKCAKYLDLFKTYTEIYNLEVYKKEFEFRDAVFLMKYNLKPNVEKIFLRVYDYFDKINDNEFRREVHLQLANYYLRTSDTKSGLHILAILFSKFSLEARHLITLRTLIDFALSRPELVQYKDKIHNAFTQFFDRLNIEGTTDEYKRKMKIEIEKLYDIKMTSFGSLEFVSRGVPVSESKWKKKRGKFILAYMMLNPKAKYNKDKIIDVFFPDSKPETVEDSFKQAIFTIRSTFKNPYLNFLILENKMLYLNSDCYFKSDAEEFNKLCTIARSAEHSCEEKIKACKDAIELYKGEFMEGNYEPWCEDLRGDFHNKFISISELLLVSLVQMKKYEDVIRYSGKLLKHDKLNEKAYLSLVEAFVKTGKPKSARESYTKMLKTYKEELGERPDQKTLSKMESLLES